MFNYYQGDIYPAVGRDSIILNCGGDDYVFAFKKLAEGEGSLAISRMYGLALASMLGGLTADESHNIDWLSDTIKIMLCTSSYTPNQDTHQFKSSITGEVSGTGYVEGGATLTGKTITYDPDTNMVKLDADDVVWENSTITARYAVIYDDTPENNTDKPVLGYIDFEEDKSSNAGNFTLQWNTNGIFTLATP